MLIIIYNKIAFIGCGNISHYHADVLLSLGCNIVSVAARLESDNIDSFADKYGISSDDLKNLTIANLLMDLKSKSSDNDEQTLFSNLFNLAKGLGMSDKKLR